MPRDFIEFENFLAIIKYLRLFTKPKEAIQIKMNDEYKICKRCKHLQRNHLIYKGDNKCTKCDCQQFID